LGVPSFGELFDVRLDGTPDAAELIARLVEVAPEGLVFREARRVPDWEPALAKRIAASDFVFSAGDEARAADFMARDTAPVPRGIDARPAVLSLDLLEATPLARALGWPERPLLRARLRVSAEGSVKPAELAELLGISGAEVARLGLVGEGGSDPFEPPDQRWD